MEVKQISVFLENRNGQLKEVTKILADNNIDIEALNIAETAEYGIVRLIVDDVQKAIDALIGDGFIISVNPVTVCNVPNVVGSLNRVLDKIAAANINIEYMYSIFGGKNAESKMVFKSDDSDLLEKAIG